MSQYLTPEQAAQRLGCRRPKVYAMIRDGLLVGYRFGPRMVRVKEDDIERLAATCTMKPAHGVSVNIEDTTPPSPEADPAAAALNSMKKTRRALKALSAV